MQCRNPLRALRRLARDERAAMAPAIAGFAVVMVASAGMALDVGLHYVDNRQLHAATEAAALAAAMSPSQAQARATNYLVHNGYEASVLKSVQVGRYCADSSLSAEQRFDTTYTRCPGNLTSTAVRITTQKASRRYLSKILGGVAIPDISSTATAARIDEAGIAITSGLLNVSNSLVLSVNNLLGTLLGVQLNLTAADIQALMGGNVDAGLFFDKLAVRANKPAGTTYNTLVQGSYGIKDIALAAADATSNATTKAALTTFGNAVSNSYTVPLKDLFGLGVWKNMPVGEADRQPGLRAGLNAYQLLTYAVQAGPGTIDASHLVNLVLPANPSQAAKITAISNGTVDRPRFSFGPAGETSVGTSALRLQVLLSDITVDVPLILSTKVNVPVLVDVAAAQAQIKANGIDCASTAEQRANTRVTVAASSGLVNAYIGNAPASAMTKPMPTLTAADITSTQLINTTALVGLLQITASGRVIGQPVTGQSRDLVFGPGGNGTIGSPTSLGTAATVGNGSQVGNTLSGLTGSLTSSLDVNVTLLKACIWPLCTTDPNAVKNSVLGALVTSITTPVSQLAGTAVDPLLDNVLAALGVQLGYATVWATGARCGVPVLV
ncbi:MAG: hypothetical protein J7496_01155 [Novosphingobium sp.]|nr:hypothetical protein [Novosphingobium sp.]